MAAKLTLGAACLLVTACHTAEGVKQDTKSALDATGKGLQRGAEKIDGPEATEPKKDVKKDKATN
jgi:predicted small secreted protein